MNYAYLFLLLITCSMLHGADTNKESFNQRIERVARILLTNHTAAAHLESIGINTSKGSGIRNVKQVALHIQNHYELEQAMDTIEGFDWKHGKRSDAPEGTRQMGQVILFLASANKTLGVTSQEMSDDKDLLTTFKKPISFETLKSVFKQVPTTGGFSTFEKTPRGVVQLSRGMYWNFKPE